MPDRIKLALVTHGLSSNGIESFLMSVVRRIDRETYDVTFVIALDPGEETLHGAEVESLGMRVLYVCDLDSLQKKAQYARMLEEIFRREKFDVVHANMDLLSGVVLRAAKRAGVPKRVCHAHTAGSQYTLEHSGIAGRTAQKLYHAVMKRLILQNATALIGCSELANRYMYGKRGAQAQVIHNGFDLQPYLAAAKAPQDAPDVRRAAVTFAAVGRISYAKNPLFILSVMEELARLRQDFVLNWAGTGEMVDRVRSEIASRGLEPYVHLLGVRKDIPAVLSMCDYFLFPSLFEGLGIVLVEAQAAGLECFASDVVPRMADAGLCRFLSLDDGASGWAREIDRVLQSGEKMQIDEARLQLYSIENTLRELDAVYRA